MQDARSLTALVVAAYGRRGFVEADSRRRAYLVKGRSLRVVCGDLVQCRELTDTDELVVTAILQRRNALVRVSQKSHAPEVLAANLTQLIPVCAPAPEPDLFLLDRYVCAAEVMDCRIVIAWNKCDLAGPGDALVGYQQLGYPLVELSAHSGHGLPALSALLDGQVSALVGQSGVGKSSLINALVPGSQAETGELSGAMSMGRHTTTTVVMYTVGHSGRLIDTPGVRDFIPAIGTARRVDQGFREIAAAATGCRFADCGHDQEPGCAVKRGVARGAIDARRYASYLRLRKMVGAAAVRTGV